MRNARMNPDQFPATVKPHHVRGFELQTFGGGRYTTVAWYPNQADADKERERLFVCSFWRDYPPRVVPG